MAPGGLAVTRPRPASGPAAARKLAVIPGAGVVLHRQARDHEGAGLRPAAHARDAWRTGPTGTAAFRVLNRRAAGTVIQVMEGTQVATFDGWRRPGLRVAGAGLLAATAGIHLDPYLAGCPDTPRIRAVF